MKLAYSPDFVTRIILGALEEGVIENDFIFEHRTNDEILESFENRTINIGFVSPLQYAKSRGGLQICQDFVISQIQPAKSILLFFKKNLDNIRTIYFLNDPASEYERFIGKLVINEFLDIEADWHSLEKIGLIQNALDKYSTILLTGKPAYQALGQVDTFLDLSEEWLLKTNMPLVSRLLVVRNGIVLKEEVGLIKRSAEMIFGKSTQYAEKIFQSGQFSLELIRESYNFTPDNPTWESLMKILNYAFYYAMSDYIPQLSFMS